MRTIPILTGVLTVGMLGFVGWVLISEGAWLIGSVALGFGVLRLVVFVIQVVRWIQAARAEDEDEASVEVE